MFYQWSTRSALSVFTLRSWKVGLSTLIVIIVSPIARWLCVCTPMWTLGIVRRSIIVHGCLSCFIYSISTPITLVISCFILLHFKCNETSVNRYLSVFRTEFHNHWSIICLCDSSFVSLPFPTRYHYSLANILILASSVHTSNCLSISYFHEFLAQDLYIPCLLNKESIWLGEFSIP